jgi:hypothetical protein
MEGHRTPEDAAMVGFPAEHCRVVAARSDGDDAYVLLDTGSDGQRYLYGASYRRHEGRWCETASGNGCGWSHSSSAEGQDVGTWSLWEEAPPGADLVRVEFGAELTEHAIHDGVYFVVWFRRPNATAPRVTAFRIDGRWVAHTDWRSLWPALLPAEERFSE